MKTLSEIIMEEFIMGAIRTIPKRVDQRVREIILNKFSEKRRSTTDQNIIKAIDSLYFDLMQSDLEQDINK